MNACYVVTLLDVDITRQLQDSCNIVGHLYIIQKCNRCDGGCSTPAKIYLVANYLEVRNKAWIWTYKTACGSLWGCVTACVKEEIRLVRYRPTIKLNFYS